MSTKKFIENYLFVKCRNKGFNNKNDFIGYLHDNYKNLLKIIEPGDVYLKIINYQIKKYGGTLGGNIIYEEGNKTTIVINRPMKRKTK